VIGVKSESVNYSDGTDGILSQTRKQNTERGPTMKKGILLSFFSLVAVFAMITIASANSADWKYFTNAADVGKGPGTDLLMGTGDDVPDAKNTAGAYSTTSIIWDPADPTCGPPSTGYLTGSETRCMGTPTGGFTVTYLNVTQTETIPGSGTVMIKLTPGAAPSTGDNCNLGNFTQTTRTTMYMAGGGSLPMPPTTSNGKFLNADVAVSGDFVCGTTTYTQAYLESVRVKLPAAATRFAVVCASISFGPLPIKCLNNASTQGTSIIWTDDTIDCGAQCCDNDSDGFTGVQCTAGNDCVDTNPAVHPGATEICGNGLDDDCVGGDEACPGACAP
jgi:Putative metal-binding motif